MFKLRLPQALYRFNKTDNEHKAFSGMTFVSLTADCP
jgi:hypothetical protein